MSTSNLARHILISIISIWLFIPVAEADAGCNYTGGSSSVAATIQLQNTSITVGRDVAVGAVIYQQNISPPPIKILCQDVLILNRTRTGTLSNTLPLSNLTTGPYANKTYQTSIPGIGVVFSTIMDGVAPFSTTESANLGYGSYYIFSDKGYTSQLILSLIKTGPISIASTNTITGGSLPILTQVQNDSGTLLGISTTSVVGNLSILTRTCQTPNVNVQMGNHSVTEFSGPGTTTGWNSFNIQLTNCPSFNTSTSGFGTPSAVSYTIDATQATVQPADSVYGNVLSLNNSGQPPAANIGVQVANNAGSPLILSTSYPSGLALTNIDQSSYSIPLKARYIQTGTSISPGPANASATFTISYQ